MLEGACILVVEDEYLLAQDLGRELTAAGATVLGPEPSVDGALARIAAAPRIDAGVLDVNLGGRPVYPVAAALTARGVPILFATGYGEEQVKGRFPDAITCDKPVDGALLVRVLAGLIRRGPAGG